MSIVHNSVQHNRTKHIGIGRHFIKDILDNGLMVTIDVPTRFQMTNIFTKGLSHVGLYDFVSNLEMIDIHLLT